MRSIYRRTSTSQCWRYFDDVDRIKFPSVTFNQSLSSSNNRIKQNKWSVSGSHTAIHAPDSVGDNFATSGLPSLYALMSSDSLGSRTSKMEEEETWSNLCHSSGDWSPAGVGKCRGCWGEGWDCLRGVVEADAMFGTVVPPEVKVESRQRWNQ